MPVRKFFLRLATALLLLYALVLGWFYVNQRKLLFPVPPVRTPAIPGAQLLHIDGAGGSVFLVVHAPIARASAATAVKR